MTPETCHLIWSNFWIGILFALIVGAGITPTFQQLVDRYVRLAPYADDNRIPPSLTGHIERIFFTIVVAFDVSGAVPGMMTWIVAKMAANWNSEESRAAAESRTPAKTRELLNRRFSALLTSTVSLTLALIGGLVGKGSIPVSRPFIAISALAVIIALIVRLTFWLLARRRSASPTGT